MGSTPAVTRSSYGGRQAPRRGPKVLGGQRGRTGDAVVCSPPCLTRMSDPPVMVAGRPTSLLNRLLPARGHQLGWTRIARDGLSIAGVIMLVFFWREGWPPALGADTYAYWVADPVAPYHPNGDPLELGAFRYSPAVAQLLSLVNWLPWDVFFWLWMGLLFAAVVYIGRWWSVAILGFPPVLISLWYGNIDVLLAAAVVAGFRWPATWAFILLTKVTPGLGLLWFAIRREWRSLAIALAATAVIATISFVIAPSPWFEWPKALMAVSGFPGQDSLPLRLAAAALLVGWGALTDRRWTVAAAAALANPTIAGRAFAMVIGVVPLLRWQRDRSRAAESRS